MTSQSDFKIQTSGEEPDRLTIRAAGELDSATSAALEGEVDRALGEHDVKELLLDLSQISFLDSAGLRVMILVEQAAARRSVELVVIPPPEEMLELLRVTGLADRLRFAGPASDGPQLLEATESALERNPGAPRMARTRLREAVGSALPDSAMQIATLLTSEIVTNAVIHPQNPADATIGLRISRFKDGVRVEVSDSGQGFDPARWPQPDAGQEWDAGGRGLMVVDRAATRWGARREPDENGGRFYVWFELAASLPDARPMAAEG